VRARARALRRGEPVLDGAITELDVGDPTRFVLTPDQLRGQGAARGGPALGGPAAGTSGGGGTAGPRERASTEGSQLHSQGGMGRVSSAMRWRAWHASSQ
jgi:hypothetical protein